MLKNNLKNKLGDELLKFRTQNHIRLHRASDISSIPWPQIDALETGCKKNWDVYDKLLKAYGKDIKIELVDR